MQVSTAVFALVVGVTLLGCGRNDTKVCPDPTPSSKPGAAPIRLIDLPFPKAASGTDNDMWLKIAIEASGRTTVDKRAIDDDRQIVAAAKEAVARNPNVRVAIIADDSAAYGRVIAVVDLLRTTGVTNLHFGARSLPNPVWVTDLPDAK